jgi:hypothetical protein
VKQVLGTSGRGVIVLCTVLGIGLAAAEYVRFQTNSLSPSDTLLTPPRPPLVLRNSRFSCLDSLADGRTRKRVVKLRGLDWTLDSTVELNCFPEREVVMSVEVGRHFLRQPSIDHIRFWIVKNGDAIYARIVESTGSQELDMDALDLVTNHKCGLQNRKNCHVESAHAVPRID